MGASCFTLAFSLPLTVRSQLHLFPDLHVDSVVVCQECAEPSCESTMSRESTVGLDYVTGFSPERLRTRICHWGILHDNQERLHARLMLGARAARGEPRWTHGILDFICLYPRPITCVLARCMAHFKIGICEGVLEASMRGLEKMSFGQDRSVRGQSADAKILCTGIGGAVCTPKRDREQRA